MKPLNKPDPPNPAGAPRFHFRHQWRGVGDMPRWVQCTKRNVKTLQHIMQLVAFSLCAGALFLSCSPPAHNDGRESGYYGDFNRVSNALVSIPGVVVTNFWMNRDITLEEFGFEALTGAGKAICVAVGERDPLRQMSRAELVAALKKEIERQAR